MDATVIVANALVAGQALAASDAPASASGAFRSGRRGMDSVATASQEAGKGSEAAACARAFAAR